MKKVFYKIGFFVFTLFIFLTACKVDVIPDNPGNDTQQSSGNDNNNQNAGQNNTDNQNNEAQLIEAAKKMPLTLLAEEDGVITLEKSYLVTNLKYTINSGESVAVNSDEPVTIPVSKDDEANPHYRFRRPMSSPLNDRRIWWV